MLLSRVGSRRSRGCRCAGSGRWWRWCRLGVGAAIADGRQGRQWGLSLADRVLLVEVYCTAVYFSGLPVCVDRTTTGQGFLSR